MSYNKTLNVFLALIIDPSFCESQCVITVYLI